MQHENRTRIPHFEPLQKTHGMSSLDPSKYSATASLVSFKSAAGPHSTETNDVPMPLNTHLRVLGK